MAKIKKGDFIELDYTGKFTNDQVFDTSVKEIGEQNKLQKPSYEPLIVCVGEGQVIKGLDKNLEGSETEKNYTFEIETEEGQRGRLSRVWGCPRPPSLGATSPRRELLKPCRARCGLRLRRAHHYFRTRSDQVCD